MKYIFTLIIAIFSGFVSAEESNFEKAMEIWEKQSKIDGYQLYSNQFSQYNNSLKLDERNGCYQLGQDAVELFLIIGEKHANGFSGVEDIIYSKDSKKTQCFIKSYLGLKVKEPPFTPYFLRMNFGN